MSRTMVVTGAASGTGEAVAGLLRQRGDRVIGVDLRNADVVADLGSPDGRLAFRDQVAEHANGSIDGVVAAAGLAAPVPGTVSVNYFGMIATLELLRPLLLQSSAPRAVGVSSMSSIQPLDAGLVDLLSQGDEARALTRAEELAADPQVGQLIYPATKKAFAQWVRRAAVSDEWAGAGIPLNAIAPGMVVTPRTAPFRATEEGREQMRAAVPMPLGGFADALVPARLLAWLVSEEKTHVTGQVVFVDGGSDAVIRGDSTW
ncbi:SDR family oxidoreductase [Herbiconiux ginsengi]|uniref:NAD(P)-dependent dehydrogenase, short-chain alcohol dehydrogenase family n=1 Tax=Herbiconiux ginsengi TaxID=381665 RepID=A0A1H3TGD9_9MICO|nr:SDR family oxidoreductase [Herbiconiux ginsengi]SDZ49160.1 NAD(P)-dependent dehydrogenase, short-chain alcohol dehydrogenase family [Herbiconiux ginsengi]